MASIHRVLLYEFTCSGGLLHQQFEAHKVVYLQREGRAMLSALASDFARIEGYQTRVLIDERAAAAVLPGCEVILVGSAHEEIMDLQRRSGEADWTVIIAPEFDNLLYERCRWVEEAGGRLLGASPELVSLTSDKHRTAGHLRAHGVAAPEGVAWSPGQPVPPNLEGPLVVKPLNGAGSLQSYCFDDQAALMQHLNTQSGSLRVERFVPGGAASVAFLCGPKQCLPLSPCWQRMAQGSAFHYLGGAHSLPPDLANRAVRLASRAIATLPQPLGFLGVDLVLGEPDDGGEDCVIEINPRLTTSYVGLRAATTANLAQAMLDVAEGREVGVSFSQEPLEFDADGIVRRI